MLTQRISDVILPYFAGFKNKDVCKITTNFSDDIVLIDWTGSWVSRMHVGSAIQSIVEKNDIEIIPRQIYESSKGASDVIVTCLIDIVIDQGDPIRVVDLITVTGGMYGGAWKISKIDAFKQ